MPSTARAPGKLVALGEYAVLDGAPALVLAVNRYAEAMLHPSTDGLCRLTTLLPDAADHVFEPGAPSGVALVDVVTAGSGGVDAAWDGRLDSSAFFGAGGKLGLGSSAAALCAWVGAFTAYRRSNGTPAAEPTLAGLIRLHRTFQGGKGSGVDVAASFAGGAVVFRLAGPDEPQIGSVRLPNSVGFAGIFAGRSASTPELVAHYRTWRTEHPKRAADFQRRLAAIAEVGCGAARGNDATAFLRAIDEYGRALQNLGAAMGADIVTAEHLRIGEHARRFGVAYKVSGAGGGDLGLACASEPEALDAFAHAVGSLGFQVIDLSLAEHGLMVDERVGSSLK